MFCIGYQNNGADERNKVDTEDVIDLVGATEEEYEVAVDDNDLHHVGVGGRDPKETVQAVQAD